MRPVLRQKVTVIHVDVFLEEAAHQAVLVSCSAGFDAIRCEQEARSFNASATDYVEARLGDSFFPCKRLELDALDRVCSCTRDNCRYVCVQKDGHVGGIFQLLPISLSEIRLRAPSRTFHIEPIRIEGGRLDPKRSAKFLIRNARANLKHTFRMYVVWVRGF